VAGNSSSINIPNFIAALTPQGLRRLMLMNNLKHGYFFKYYSIEFINGKWYAWYYAEADSKDMSNMVKGGG